MAQFHSLIREHLRLTTDIQICGVKTSTYILLYQQSCVFRIRPHLQPYSEIGADFEKLQRGRSFPFSLSFSPFFSFFPSYFFPFPVPSCPFVMYATQKIQRCDLTKNDHLNSVLAIYTVIVTIFVFIDYAEAAHKLTFLYLVFSVVEFVF